ncbi:MAG: methyl-accepting chemotaxis protein [Burkholderiaceae bacterium]
MKSLRSLLLMLICSGLLASAVLTGASLWGGATTAAATQRALVAKDVTADILPPPLYLIELRLVLSEAVEGTMPLATAQGEAARLEKEFGERVEYWTANPPYGLQAQLLGRQLQAGKRFMAAARTVLAALAGGDAAGAQAALRTANEAYLDHRAGVDETVKVSTTFADATTESLARMQRQLRLAQLGVLGLATVVLLGLGRWAHRTVWSAAGGEPAHAAEIARAVAEGNLAVDVPVAGGDQASVMAAMQRMCVSLSQLVAQVRRSSDSMATASARIAQGNGDLSVRTEAQASALQQTAASMEQLSATVRDNAERAVQASRLAELANDAARQGGQAVGGMVDTMKAINDSSREIGDIVGVIDGIAFQTNILALNAAVEAARAGEQGRGFAVVAAEVRALAGRSAQAAREIKTLIGTSVERVEHGAGIAEAAGATMNEVMASIHRVTEVVADISAASVRQSAGVTQVGQAVAQMDQATHSNAALVQESAAAAESLRAQAQQLLQAVTVFRLRDAA